MIMAAIVIMVVMMMLMLMFMVVTTATVMLMLVFVLYVLTHPFLPPSLNPLLLSGPMFPPEYQLCNR